MSKPADLLTLFNASASFYARLRAKLDQDIDFALEYWSGKTDNDIQQTKTLTSKLIGSYSPEILTTALLKEIEQTGIPDETARLTIQIAELRASFARSVLTDDQLDTYINKKYQSAEVSKGFADNKAPILARLFAPKI